MKISYNWLKDYIVDLNRPEELADLLTMHSFETEIVAMSDVKHQASNTILDVDVLPNRASDCLSYLGIAREISVITGKKIKWPKIELKEKKADVDQELKVSVEDQSDCLRYTARIVENINVKDSPDWLKQKIQDCGLKPINNIVDIVNYVMLEYGQPLHIFDFFKIEDVNPKSQIPNPKQIQNPKSQIQNQKKKLIVRRAKKGENITTLDGTVYELDEEVLVIADAKNPLCIAGIKGGKKPEVNERTQKIVLEAANFSSSLIRKTSKKLNLKTDASWRFENQLDPNLTEKAIDRAAYLIQEIAEGQTLKDRVDFYPKKKSITKIKLETSKVQNLLGINISTSQIASILKRLGIETEKQKDFIKTTIPTFRLDLNLQEDLIEEIARLYGLKNISSQLPDAIMIPPKRNDNLFYKNKTQDILHGLGFSEVYNYSFISEKIANKFISNQKELVEVSNPVSQDQKYIRPNLAINLLKATASNKKYFDEIKLFEIGKVFQFQQKQVKEKKRLSAAVSFKNRTQKADEFYFLKGILEKFFQSLRINEFWFNDNLKDLKFLPVELINNFRTAEVKVNNKSLGLLAEANQKALNSFSIKQKIAFFELDFDKIAELATEERIYTAPSKYPAVTRDIAVIVDRTTKIEEVMNIIHSAGGQLVKDIDLFDIYEGKGISGNKKSLAFHIIFQSNEYTLTDEEVNQLQDKIIQDLENKFWEVRR